MTSMRSLLGYAILMTCFLGSSQAAWACAACFGKSDSRLAVGMNWGIMTLLVVVFCVLSAIASFFVFLSRRGAALRLPDGETQAAESSSLPKI